MSSAVDPVPDFMTLSPHASAELVAVVEAAAGRPVRITDPRTGQVYDIIFRRVEPAAPPEPRVDPVPPGIRAAQRAFWAALPGLLADRRTRGKWVLFGPDGLIRASHSAAEVMDLLAQNMTERYISRAEPMEQPPWVPELVEFTDRGGIEYDDEE